MAEVFSAWYRNSVHLGKITLALDWGEWSIPKPSTVAARVGVIESLAFGCLQSPPAVYGFLDTYTPYRDAGYFVNYGRSRGMMKRPDSSWAAEAVDAEKCKAVWDMYEAVEEDAGW